MSCPSRSFQVPNLETPLLNPSVLLFIAKADENGQTATGAASGSSERLYWPGASALTARLRRLITAYQRSNRREQLRQEALNRPDGRRRRRREFLPAIAMVTDAGAATTYIQDASGVFVTEGGPYMAKGSGYFAKGGQFLTEASQAMSTTSLMSDGAMYYKEKRQRYVECTPLETVHHLCPNFLSARQRATFGHRAFFQ